MSDFDSSNDKTRNRMELRIKKYKSEVRFNRLIFLALAFLNLVAVMILSFTGSAKDLNYTMNLTYVRVCIGISVLTVIFSIAPIIKSILE